MQVAGMLSRAALFLLPKEAETLLCIDIYCAALWHAGNVFTRSRK